MKGDEALYRINSYKKGNGIALAFTGKTLSDLGLDGPCELDVSVSDGAIVLRKVQPAELFPLRFNGWTFHNWEEVYQCSGNQLQRIATEQSETAGNGGEEANLDRDDPSQLF